MNSRAAADTPERKCIYRNVDVRALAHFHAGEGGLSVNAERIWCRLLIDDASTPVPGLVLARRGDLVDRCRMTSKQFNEAFRELENALDQDGQPAPMAIANWPIGVVILPGAPRQLCHKPASTSIPVAWRKFIDQSAPRCQEVSRLIAAWEQALSEYGEAFIEAFRYGSRGTYKKPVISGGEPVSPNYSAKRSPNGSASRSQDPGSRIQDHSAPTERGDADGAPGDQGDGVPQETQKKRRSKPKAPKAPKDPAVPPMLFTIADMLTALRETCEGQIIVDPYDQDLSKRLTEVARSLQAAGCTIEDVRLAGEYAAVVVPTWNLSDPLGLGWVATAGKLSSMIGKARAWRDRGRVLQKAGGNGAPGPRDPRQGTMPAGDFSKLKSGRVDL